MKKNQLLLIKVIEYYLPKLTNKPTKELDDMNQVYTVVGIPSQLAAVLNLRREAIINKKYISLIISMILQFTSL